MSRSLELQGNHTDLRHRSWKVTFLLLLQEFFNTRHQAYLHENHNRRPHRTMKGLSPAPQDKQTRESTLAQQRSPPRRFSHTYIAPRARRHQQRWRRLRTTRCGLCPSTARTSTRRRRRRPRRRAAPGRRRHGLRAASCSCTAPPPPSETARGKPSMAGQAPRQQLGPSLFAAILYLT
jgi:hypothetical protein